MIQTSVTHPLRIDAVSAPGGGLIGMTLCPGKHQPDGATGAWRRDLDRDLAVIQTWGAVAVVTLMETPELARYGVGRLGPAIEALGMEWHHLPIIDTGVPRGPFETGWQRAGPMLRTHLLQGRRILLHCLGGLGRTGMVAARLLAELGVHPPSAIAAVRAARPGTIENTAQEVHALSIRPLPCTPHSA